MKIAVIADTHNRLPDEVCERIRHADEIWHIGDVCTPAIIERLGKLAPLRFVSGNCDEEPDWPATLDFVIDGFRFHLEHIPSTRPPTCDIFLHGHTHVPRDETIKGVRFLNPGCITRPKSAPPSFAWLTIEHGRLEWKVTPV